MNIVEILKHVDHRPWYLPNTKWSYYQEWNDAIFLHWKVDAKDLVKWVPEELEVELYNGSAWVSVVAFSMANIRLRNLPAFSPISDFHELNIRTYVRHNGRSGVFFLSIEGAKLLSCKIARAMSRLPYKFSPMKRVSGSFQARNKLMESEFNLGFVKGEVMEDKEALDIWLTEKYALFQDTKLGITEFEIHHVPWEIMNIDSIELDINYPSFQQYFSCPPDKIHYSSGVQVLAWSGKRHK